MNLKECFDKHHCDKGSLKHRYDRVYEPALKHLRNEPITILEIGILRGESVRAWLDYFPNANIAAIDIFTRVPAKDIPVLQEPRVHWAVCDSMKPPSKGFLSLPFKEYDVIIDDGLHTHDSQRLTFQHLYPFLKEGGLYFIEDVWPFDIMTKEEKKHDWLLKNKNDYSDEQYCKLLNVLPNYKYHDLRHGFHPDTFIIEIVK